MQISQNILSFFQSPRNLDTSWTDFTFANILLRKPRHYDSVGNTSFQHNYSKSRTHIHRSCYWYVSNIIITSNKLRCRVVGYLYIDHGGIISKELPQHSFTIVVNEARTHRSERCESNILQLLGIPGRILVPPVT